MPEIIYIDACAGASGDMLSGAWLDLGWPLEDLRGLIARMGLAGVEVDSISLEHQGVAARRLEVRVAGRQPHRHLGDILDILERLPPEIGRPAAAVFRSLARAEARVHGVSEEQVHFHEVGAADAVVDVVAFCAGLVWSGAGEVVCSPLPLGRGFIQCAHGRLPLPAPAVLHLLRGAPVRDWPAQEETVTPTGAAIISTLARDFGEMPAMRLRDVGVGGGSRSSPVAPNILRLLRGQVRTPAGRDRVVEITCHIDDQSPEDLPLVFEALFKAGALDAAAAPLVMKKGRPGLMLVVLAPQDRAEDLAALVLEQTTSLGVRLARLERRILARRLITVETPWGPVGVKMAGSRMHPEAEDVARICRQTGLAPYLVRREILRLCPRSD